MILFWILGKEIEDLAPFDIYLFIVFLLLIILSIFDLKYKAVPDYLLILVLIFAFLSHQFDIQVALMFAGAFVILELFVTFYVQNIKARWTEVAKDQKSLGEGDIPIVAVIGGVLGIYMGVIAILISTILAILPAIYNHFYKKEIETPFIPYLSLGLFIVFIFRDYFTRILS